VFVEDYDMKVARELVQAVDIWLNTPRRGEEACGTSGMKAAVNGVLNLSILDGWFDEAFEMSGGWAIGDREPYSEEQDAIHASNIYYLLEREIVPLFYAQSQGGNSSEWIRRMKESMVNLTPAFDARRMVNDYDTELYSPAHKEWERLRDGKFADAKKRAEWNNKVREIWSQVTFLDTDQPAARSVTSGESVVIRTSVRLAGLQPGDIRVECVVGRVGSGGSLEETSVVLLPVREFNGEVAVFEKDIVPVHTGRLGYALRVSPNHYENPLTRPVSSLLKWSGR
jgi:starch phosphorylase